MLTNHRRGLAVSAALLGAAVIVAVLVAVPTTRSYVQLIDDAVADASAVARNQPTTAVSTAFSLVGSVWVNWPLRVLVGILLLRRRRFLQFSAFALAVLSSEILIGTLKALYDRPRPLDSLIETSSSSFPSGHAIAGAVTAVGIVLALVPPGKARWRWEVAAVIFSSLMALSRVYLHAHWLSDTVAGALIGAGLALGWPAILQAIRGRRAASVWVATLLVLSLNACGPSAPLVEDRGDTFRVASYDFGENVILAEIYGQALQRNGIEVSTVHGLGTRELVIPALEQGQVDLVVDYLGTALDFVAGPIMQTESDATAVHADLRTAFAARGVTVLDHAQAEDQNGFAVTTERAVAGQLINLSDLVAIAPTLHFGAPPECPTRRYCLIGLEEVYGLEFASFRPMPSRDATAEALYSGEIDIGLLETTDARLSSTRLVLLADDLGLQPRENVVPLVRTGTLDSAGPRLRDILDAVSAELTTADLIALNGEVEIEGRSPAAVAAEWLRAQGLD